MSICVFCSADIPSEQLDTHITNNHPSFVSPHTDSNPPPHTNHSFISHNIWQSSDTPNTLSLTPIGAVYDCDILKPLIFLDGKRITENYKKHKRNSTDSHCHNRRPNKRRKLNKKHKKNKSKNAPQIEDFDIEEEGEEDHYYGLPYHFHLATHCEPKLTTDTYTNIQTLLNSHTRPSQTLSNDRSDTKACVLHKIDYANDHLSLEWTENDSQMTEEMCKSDSISDVSVYGCNARVSNQQMSDVIMADLRQYNFITNALYPSPTPPPLVCCKTAINVGAQKCIEAKAKQKKTVTMRGISSPIPAPLNVNRNETLALPPMVALSPKRTHLHTPRTPTRSQTQTHTRTSLALPTLQTPKFSPQKPRKQSQSQPRQSPLMAQPLLSQLLANNNGKLSLINMIKRKHFSNKSMQNSHANSHLRHKLHQMIQSQRSGHSQIIAIEDIANVNASPTTSNTTSNSTNSMNSQSCMESDMHRNNRGNVNRGGVINIQNVNIINTLNALHKHSVNMTMNNANNGFRNYNGFNNGQNRQTQNGTPQRNNGNGHTFSLLHNFNLNKYTNNNRRK